MFVLLLHTVGGDEHFYMFICDLSIFLTSTAFVDTKAKSRVGGVKAHL